LTANEQAQVAVAAHARNFDACRYGYLPNQTWTCQNPRLWPCESGSRGNDRNGNVAADH
jgi:hypothetical protein